MVTKNATARKGSYKLTDKGERLNKAAAAMQDARENGVSMRKLRSVEDEYLAAIKWFVTGLANKFKPRNAHLRDDYLQTAYLGALEALKTWDRERGSASTVVGYAVRNELNTEVRTSEFPGLSRHHFNMRWTISKQEREAEDANVSVATEEIAKNSDLPVTAVKYVRGYSQPSSLDRKINGDDDAAEMSSFLVGDTDVAVWSPSKETERQIILDALYRVDAIEASHRGLYVVTRALGLDGEPPESFAAMKRDLGRTNTESLRQLNQRIQRKMVDAIFNDPESFGLTLEELNQQHRTIKTADLIKDPWDILYREVKHIMPDNISEEHLQSIVKAMRPAYDIVAIKNLSDYWKGSVDHPGARVWCSSCNALNDPRKILAIGCWRCKTVAGKIVDVSSSDTADTILYFPLQFDGFNPAESVTSATLERIIRTTKKRTTIPKIDSQMSLLET